MVAGGALESGQVGSHCQPELVSERRKRMAWGGGQAGEAHHAASLGRSAGPAKPCNGRRGPRQDREWITRVSRGQ